MELPASASPHRSDGFPTGPARAWLRGGEKHCHRVAIWRGKIRSPPRARGRVSASQGGRHCHGWSGSNPCRQGSNYTIPIVMAQDDDPVGSGFVASLARPGGNITGLSTLAPEISGKRLELLKETVPKLSRVAVLGTSTSPGNAQALKEMELAAGAFKSEASIPGHTKSQGY